MFFEAAVSVTIDNESPRPIETWFRDKESIGLRHTAFKGNSMNNKNSLIAGKVLGFATILAMAAVSQARDIYVSVDGQKVNFEGTQPQMMGDHVMVPLRGVFEKMGASVDWKSGDRMVLARRGETQVELRINNNQAYVNGKAVSVQYPPIMLDGATMVPIRFISESLGAYVDWDETASTVFIDTTAPTTAASRFADRNRDNRGDRNRDRDNRDRDNANSGKSFVMSVQPKGSVLPVKLDTKISSDDSMVGDKFTATIDTNGGNDYFGLPQGTKIEGHVNFAQPKKGDTPGVLGLDFDSVLLADGTRVPITAALIGLDNKSVTNDNGRLVATNDGKKDDLKYVGTGAGAGALIALVTKGNVVTNSLIGGALGYLYQQLIGNKEKKDVVLDRGTPLGVRFDKEARIRVYNN